MVRVLVSACLLGEKVRYNGAAAGATSSVLARWLAEGRIVSCCPELSGGLAVPRPAAEINGNGGDAVLDGSALVMTRAGADVTTAFLRGAHIALDVARAQGVRLAVLKDGSPSCGSESIHDGAFVGVRRRGHGVTTALLERHGIRVFSEVQWEKASEYLNELERDS